MHPLDFEEFLWANGITEQMNNVIALQRDIVHSYEDDMVKYADNLDKPLIKECFESILNN